jgi:hypothetical protein
VSWSADQDPEAIAPRQDGRPARNLGAAIGVLGRDASTGISNTNRSHQRVRYASRVLTQGSRAANGGILRFPNPVDEVVARLVAAGVVALAGAAALTGTPWLFVPLALGFVLRVLFGPRVSPLALLVTRVVRPRLPVAPRYVPGPPKRFAQGIGAMLSIGALAAALAGAPGLARLLAAAIVVAATLESALGLCLGCRIFAGLVRLGVVPEAVCVACADVSARR